MFNDGGGVCGKVDILSVLCVVGGGVLLEIVACCCLCDDEFCTDVAAKSTDPSITCLHGSLIRVVVIVEPLCCGVSLVTFVGY